jgi:hypothetical protein
MPAAKPNRSFSLVFEAVHEDARLAAHRQGERRRGVIGRIALVADLHGDLRAAKPASGIRSNVEPGPLPCATMVTWSPVTLIVSGVPSLST